MVTYNGWRSRAHISKSMRAGSDSDSDDELASAAVSNFERLQMPKSDHRFFFCDIIKHIFLTMHAIRLRYFFLVNVV